MQNRRIDDGLIGRMDTLEHRQDELKKSIDTNTLITKQIQENTDELIGLFNTAKGGLKTATWLAGAFKFISGLVVAGIAFYLAVKSFLGHQ